MARLVSYKARDENRYSTFGGEVECNSSENLTETNRIKLMFKTKSSSPSSPAPNASPGKKKTSSIKSSKKCKTSMPSSQRVTISTIASPPMPNNSGSSPSTSGRPAMPKKKSWQSTKASKSKLNCCSFWSKQCARRRNCAWRQFCCCCSRSICCFCCARCKGNATDDDDDDIDAKFEQYKREMKLNSAAGDGGGGASGHDNGALQVPEITFSTDQIVTFHMNGGKTDVVEPIPSPSKSKRFRYRKYWNWNDSLRSNSDKFLETLEYDMDGENSLKRNQHFRTKGSDSFKYDWMRSEWRSVSPCLVSFGPFIACQSWYHLSLIHRYHHAIVALARRQTALHFIRNKLSDYHPNCCMPNLRSMQSLNKYFHGENHVFVD